MLNGIWIAMIVAAVLCGAVTGTLKEVGTASADSAKGAIELVVGLIGVMAFWLGLMRVLQRGGLLRSMARVLGPVTSRLFPDIPADHPAMGMMIMNITSNMLGLGNAATPFGLKAMVELDKLNAHKGVATDSMALFLAINTSNLALLPTGMIALRASLGSTSPGSILVPTILATSVSTLVAIVAAKSLQRLKWFRLPAMANTGLAHDTTHESTSDDSHEAASGSDTAEAEALADGEYTPPKRWVVLLGWGLVISVLLATALALGQEALALESGEGLGFKHVFTALGIALSDWPLVFLIVGFVLFGLLRGVNVYNAISEGGREAFQIVLKFVPYFITILVAIGMLRASGAIGFLEQFLAPATNLVGMPAEALPMALLRPLSGSGAFGVSAEIMNTHGPDSMIGNIVSTMQGSTETTFYVLALYFGVAQIKHARHTVAACLLADAAGVLAAVWACRWVLG